MGLALFDFDGTITRKDSFVDFLKFLRGDGSFYWQVFLASPTLVAWKLGIVSATKAKERILKPYFKGAAVHEMNEKCVDYLNRLEGLVRPEAREKIQWHKDQGHHIYLVSGSCTPWLMPWCKKNEIELIATELEVLFKEGKYTARIYGANCIGQEKVNRIHKEINLTEFKDVYAYGNSKSDLPMLELANHKFYNRFV